MDSSMVSKMEKAKRYAVERERFKFDNFQVTMDGANDSHVITYKDGKWGCDCGFFQQRGRCSHTMALELILEDMVDIGYDE